MFAQDVAQLIRIELDDILPVQGQGQNTNSTGQRFSDTTILTWLNTSQRKLMRDVMFPPARVQMFTIANQQRYQYLGTCIRPDSVYLNGQMLDPVDSIATIQWQQIYGVDYGAGSANPAPTPASQPWSTGSGLPASTLGPFAPSWGTLTPQGYPINTYGSYPAPSAMGSFPYPSNQPPRYVPRGGYIEIVPTPAMGAPLDANSNPIPNLVFDGIFLPPPLTSLSQPLVFPDNFDRALMWDCILLGKFSDDTSKTSESRNFALSMYKDAVTDCRMHVQSLKGMATQGPKVRTSRMYYAQPLHKNSRDSGYP
jgi:hypothetical protein